MNTKGYDKKGSSLLITLTFLIIAGLFMIPKSSHAVEKGYVTLNFSHTNAFYTTKVGKYYFQAKDQSPGEPGLWYCKKKNGKAKWVCGGLASGFSAGFCTNGKKALYVADELTREVLFNKQGRYTSICSKNLDDDMADSKEILVLKTPRNHSWEIAGSYRNIIYLNESAGFQWKLWAFNLKTKKLTKIGKVWVRDMYTNYVVGYKKEVDLEEPQTAHIYKIKNNKLYEIKTLKRMGDAIFVNGKLYYTYHPKTKGQKKRMTLYRSSLNGKNRKTLGEFNMKTSDGEMIFIDMVGSKSCHVYGRKAYRFTYKGKKLKKIKDMR